MSRTKICRPVAGALLANVFLFGFAGAVLLNFGPSTAHATISLSLPEGISRYRIALVTQGVRDATSTLIEDYNDFVRSELTASSLESALASVGASPEWFVYGSTSAVDAIDNVLSGGGDDLPIFNTRGELVASGWSQFLSQSGILSNPIAYDQDGLDYPQSLTSAVLTCTSWNGRSGGAALGSSFVSGSGDPTLIFDGQWLSNFANSGYGPDNNYPGHFYALSSPIIVDVVPECSSVCALTIICSVAVAAIRCRKV